MTSNLSLVGLVLQGRILLSLLSVKSRGERLLGRKCSCGLVAALQWPPAVEYRPLAYLWGPWGPMLGAWWLGFWGNEAATMTSVAVVGVVDEAHSERGEEALR